jgi:hypothetical protein
MMMGYMGFGMQKENYQRKPTQVDHEQENHGGLLGRRCKPLVDIQSED